MRFRSGIRFRRVTCGAVPVVGFKKPSREPRKRYSSDPKTRAAELVKDGKLGGARPGAGRPRKTHSEPQPMRATQAIAEGLRENAELAAAVIPSVLLDPTASKGQKMAAVRLGLKIESDQAEHERQEAREGRHPAELPDLDGDRTVLAAALAAKLAGNPLLARRLAAVLSGVAGSTDKPAQPF
jgi:hypothetical protein